MEITEPVEIFLGFDPGGRGNFGWSVCRYEAGGEFDQIESGLTNNAPEAVRAVERVLLARGLSKESVQAAGIDAPMFWSRTGNREIDDTIRAALRDRPRPADAPGPPRVLAVNSLWGSVLVQGVLLATYLCQGFDNLAITEAHPNALRDLLDPLPDVLGEFERESDHQLDARTAAYAAWCMRQHLQGQMDGWRNLFRAEPDPFLPLGPETPVSYWMPIP